MPANQLPSVIAWRDAYTAHLNAMRDYNARITAIRERERKHPNTFGQENPFPEWDEVEKTKRAMLALLPAMHAALIAAAGVRERCKRPECQGQPQCETCAAAGVAPASKITSVAEFCAEGQRLGLTAADLAEALKKRPEFADCLPAAPGVSVAHDPTVSPSPTDEGTK